MFFNPVFPNALRYEMAGKTDAIESILADLHTLDSKIGLIAQKLKTMEQNEEVIGRTLIALNGRLKKSEEQLALGGAGSRQAQGAQSSSEELEKKFATKQDFKELRYVLDTINPLEFATVSQVRELIAERLKDLGTESKDLKKRLEEQGPGGKASSLFKKI